jgi:hypothetical protein
VPYDTKHLKSDTLITYDGKISISCTKPPTKFYSACNLESITGNSLSEALLNWEYGMNDATKCSILVN